MKPNSNPNTTHEILFEIAKEMNLPRNTATLKRLKAVIDGRSLFALKVLQEGFGFRMQYLGVLKPRFTKQYQRKHGRQKTEEEFAKHERIRLSKIRKDAYIQSTRKSNLNSHANVTATQSTDNSPTSGKATT